MVSEAIRDGIERNLERLPVELQRRVLDFTEALAISQPRGVAGRDLLPFGGWLAQEDANDMLAVIEQGCEQVDLNGW